MSIIKITNLAENSPSTFHSSGSCIRDLSESELNLQGGGIFKQIKKIILKKNPPVIHVNPPSAVPDILIGFSVGFSI